MFIVVAEQQHQENRTLFWKQYLLAYTEQNFCNLVSHTRLYKSTL